MVYMSSESGQLTSLSKNRLSTTCRSIYFYLKHYFIVPWLWVYFRIAYSYVQIRFHLFSEKNVCLFDIVKLVSNGGLCNSPFLSK